MLLFDTSAIIIVCLCNRQWLGSSASYLDLHLVEGLRLPLFCFVCEFIEALMLKQHVCELLA